MALFVGVAGGRALDYASSQHFRGKGINERLLSNSLVDNRPLFAAVEAAGTAGSIAVAYLLHRTGHHKMERWVSIVHISVGVGGSVRNYLLRPAPPQEPRVRRLDLLEPCVRESPSLPLRGSRRLKLPRKQM